MSRILLSLIVLLFAAPVFAQTSTPTASPSATPVPEITSLQVMPAAVTIPVGTLLQVYARTTANGAYAIGDVQWTSSDNRIAPLGEGAPQNATFVRGLADGTATITAKINGLTSSCEVTVSSQAPMLKVTKP